MLRMLLLSGLSILVTGCSPRGAAEYLLTGNHFARTPNIAFGDDPRQRLDVYQPLAADGTQPVVVFLYGGRWQSGSKEEYRLLGDGLTRRGIVAVIPDYRLSPQVEFPGWVDDAADAIAWTARNVARYGGDPSRIFVVGHSAGAHTATLLALDERHLESRGEEAMVAGFVSIAGPIFTEWTDADVQALMGGPPVWPATYPINFVDGTEPPLLFLHGEADETVSPANSIRMAELFRSRGGCAKAEVYPGVGHVEIAVGFVLPWLRIAPVMEEVVAFVSDPAATSCSRASER